MLLLQRTLELHGPTGLGAKPRPELIGPVLAQVHGSLLDTVRMGFLHASRTRGRVPQALRRAAETRFVGHAAGPEESTVLRFEVAEFGATAPELFQQGQWWEAGPRPDETAFDLLAASLTDVRRIVRDSERFDHALLRKFTNYRRLLRHGLTRILLPDAQTAAPATIDEELSAAAETLSRETPPQRRVRVCGRLDLLRVSKRVLGLVLDDGSSLTAVWTPAGFVDLASFLDRRVVIEGTAEFRPSGSLLRVDADAIREASAADVAFSARPLPEWRRDYEKEVRCFPEERTPYASIFGLIPGDGSDDDFAMAVDEIS